jgi:hypothetical protein
MKEGVNFINILRAPFLSKVFAQLFSTYILALSPKFHKKRTRKTLMKSTNGLPFSIQGDRSQSINETPRIPKIKIADEKMFQ